MACVSRRGDSGGHAAWLPGSAGRAPTEHEAEELRVHALRLILNVPTAGLPIAAGRQTCVRDASASQLSLGHFQGNWGDEGGWVWRSLRLRKINNRSAPKGGK